MCVIGKNLSGGRGLGQGHPRTTRDFPIPTSLPRAPLLLPFRGRQGHGSLTQGKHPLPQTPVEATRPKPSCFSLAIRLDEKSMQTPSVGKMPEMTEKFPDLPRAGGS